jgi:hypothetical protein
MALPLRFEDQLPAGTMFNPAIRKYAYKGFKMERRFFIYHSPYHAFDWVEHIDITFRKCMKPMADRMMRVV